MTDAPPAGAARPLSHRLVSLLPVRMHRPTLLTARAIRLLVGGALVFYLFVLALRLLSASASGVADLLTRIGADGPLNLLGFGWLLAYGALSGSPVAALSLSLLHGGAVTTSEALGMVSGSRFGASMIVLVVGFVAYLRGRGRPDGIYVGVISLLTTATIYAPATAVGLLLLKGGWLHGAVDNVPVQWGDALAEIVRPVVRTVDSNVPGVVVFLLGVGSLLTAFTLFDRLLPNLDPPTPRIERFSERFRSPRRMFLLGAAITSVTMSVSISLTILVPLTMKGVVRRTDVIPYIMGANITTFIDTLFASFLVPGGGATEVVVVEMLSVTTVSVLVLVFLYGPYSRVLLGTAHLVSSRLRYLGVFLAIMAAIPLALLFV